MKAFHVIIRNYLYHSEKKENAEKIKQKTKLKYFMTKSSSNM